MKMKLLPGILALTLILSLGTAYVTYAYANDTLPNYRSFMQQQGINVDKMEQFVEQQGIDVDQMYDFMNSGASMDEMWQYMNNINIDYKQMSQFMGDQNINFGQMQQYMQQIDPNVSSQEIQGLYRSMHGTNGSSNGRNFTSMMR